MEILMLLKNRLGTKSRRNVCPQNRLGIKWEK